MTGKYGLLYEHPGSIYGRAMSTDILNRLAGSLVTSPMFHELGIAPPGRGRGQCRHQSRCWCDSDYLLHLA